MTFEEAVAQLKREDEERHAQWKAEREERIAAGKPEGIDALWERLDRTHWYDWFARRYWRVRRFLKEQVWRHYWTHGIRNFWQRGRRGWSDNDWWNFNDHMAEIIPQMMRRMAEKSHGCPMDVYDENGKSLFYTEGDPSNPSDVGHIQGLNLDGEIDEQVAIWNSVLERIAIGFDAYRVLYEIGWRHESEAEKELDRMWREAFMLMYHNYHALWD